MKDFLFGNEYPFFGNEMRRRGDWGKCCQRAKIPNAFHSIFSKYYRENENMLDYLPLLSIILVQICILIFSSWDNQRTYVICFD
jgi:hypothetical protein